MTRHVWFAVVALFPGGPVPSLAAWRYPTHDACLVATMRRVAAMAAVDAHGRFLCMYHNEPDRELARSIKVDF